MEAKIPVLLETIIKKKASEVQESMGKIPIELIEHMIVEESTPIRGFYSALKRNTEKNENAVIAEIKKASPRTGVFRADCNSRIIAQSYEENGAVCLSVATDKEFFHGSELYLDEARSNTQLPVLRKDFIISEYQVFESRVMGADCIVLIAACLSHAQLLQFTRLSYDLGMDVLIEVHNVEDLDKVAGLPIRMLEINNRDLNTSVVDLAVTTELVSQVPQEILVITEGGIASRDDVALMNSVGVQAFLIGEAFMKHEKPGEKLAQLFSLT